MKLLSMINNPALKGDLGGDQSSALDPAEILGRFIGSWWGVAYVVGALAFLLYLVRGAIELSISGGSKDRVENAKSKITNSLMGLVLLAASWALIKLVGYVLGIEILETMQIDLSKLAP